MNCFETMVCKENILYHTTHLKAIVTRATGEPLSNAATNVLLGKTLD